MKSNDSNQEMAITNHLIAKEKRITELAEELIHIEEHAGHGRPVPHNHLHISKFLPKFSVLFALGLVFTPLAVAQTPDSAGHASAKLNDVRDHFHGGDEVVFKMVLNEPLPEGANFSVRLSPTGTDQELAVGSSEPTQRDRTEFLLRTKLPERVVPGEWHIKVVWLFLPGTSWTTSTLTTNADFRFFVDGPKVDFPTKATATLVGNHD